MPDLVHLSTNCLPGVTNIEALARLKKLERMEFGARQHNGPDVLQFLDPSAIRNLRLDENHKRDFDLSRLAEFSRLEELSIEGHTKGIEAVSGLPALEELRLRCMPKKQSLDFISTLPRLRRLHIAIGGRESIDEIYSETLEELEIIRVRAFAQFPSLSQLPALRRLQIEEQARLTAISIDEEHSQLTELSIRNCKNLRRIVGLQNLRGLQKLRLGRIELSLDELLEHPLPDTLKSFDYFTLGERADAGFRARLDALGYSG